MKTQMLTHVVKHYIFNIIIYISLHLPSPPIIFIIFKPQTVEFCILFSCYIFIYTVCLFKLFIFNLKGEKPNKSFKNFFAQILDFWVQNEHFWVKFIFLYFLFYGPRLKNEYFFLKRCF